MSIIHISLTTRVGKDTERENQNDLKATDDNNKEQESGVSK